MRPPDDVERGDRAEPRRSGPDGARHDARRVALRFTPPRGVSASGRRPASRSQTSPAACLRKPLGSDGSLAYTPRFGSRGRPRRVPLSERGHGVGIVRQLMNEVACAHGDSAGSHWRLVKNVPREIAGDGP